MSLRRVGNRRPTAQDRAEALIALNLMTKAADVKGRWLWAISNTPSTLTTVASQRSYEAGSGATKIALNILELEHVDLVESGTRAGLDIIDKTQSFETVFRNNTGRPIQVYLECAAKMSDQKLHVFPTPDNAYTIEYYYRRRLFDFTAASDNPDMPGEAADYLVKGLAATLSPEYGLPLSERNDLRLEAAEALRLLKGDNAEDAPVQTISTVYF